MLWYCVHEGVASMKGRLQDFNLCRMLYNYLFVSFGMSLGFEYAALVFPCDCRDCMIAVFRKYGGSFCIDWCEFSGAWPRHLCVRMCWWASGHGRACLLLVVQLFASYVWVVRPTWVLVLSSWGSSHVDTCTCPTVFSFRFWCFCFSMRIVTVCDSLSGVFAEWSRNPGRLSYPIPLRRCMGNVVFSGVSELFFCAHSIWCPQRRLSHINLRLLYWSPVGLAWVKIYKPLHHWPCMMLCDFIGSSLNWDVYVCPICPAIHLRRCFVEWMRPLLWVVKVGFLYLGVAGVTIAAKKPIFYQKIRR